MKDIFCVICSKITPHTSYLDANNEHVYECEVIKVDANGNVVNDRNGSPMHHSFIKFPKVDNAEELNALIVTYNENGIKMAEQMSETRKQQAIHEETLKDGTQVNITSSTPSEA